MPKKQTFDQKAEVRKLARERVGTVKPSRPIEPKDTRKKPKHPKPLTEGRRTSLVLGRVFQVRVAVQSLLVEPEQPARFLIADTAFE